MCGCVCARPVFVGVSVKCDRPSTLKSDFTRPAQSTPENRKQSQLYLAHTVAHKVSEHIRSRDNNRKLSICSLFIHFNLEQGFSRIILNVLRIGIRFLFLLNQKPWIAARQAKGGFKLFIYKYQAYPLQLFPPESVIHIKK